MEAGPPATARCAALGGAHWNDLVLGVDYRLMPRNMDSQARWAVVADLSLRRDTQ